MLRVHGHHTAGPVGLASRTFEELPDSLQRKCSGALTCCYLLAGSFRAEGRVRDGLNSRPLSCGCWPEHLGSELALTRAGTSFYFQLNGPYAEI